MHRGILSLLALVLCTDASAASAPISESAVAVRAATLDRNPFGFRDEDGTPHGVSVDVFRVVANRLGRSLDVTFAGVGDISAGFFDGSIDLAVMFQHAELDGVATALGPIMEVSTGVLSQTALTCYEDLTGLRVGYVEETPFDERFDTDTSITKVPFASAAEVFDAYAGGAIDAIVGPLQYLFYQAPEYAAQSGTLFQVLPLQNRKMWLYVRTSAFTDAELSIIARSVDDMIEANMIESFSDHYFGSRVSVPEQHAFPAVESLSLLAWLVATALMSMVLLFTLSQARVLSIGLDHDAELVGELLAEESRGPLLFVDRRILADKFRALRVYPTIALVCLYDQGGRLVAAHSNSKAECPDAADGLRRSCARCASQSCGTTPQSASSTSTPIAACC